MHVTTSPSIEKSKWPISYVLNFQVAAPVGHSGQHPPGVLTDVLLPEGNLPAHPGVVLQAHNTLHSPHGPGDL